MTNALHPDVRQIEAEAHVQRSLLAWRAIHAVGRWPARLFAGHEKGAALTDGPGMSRSGVSRSCPA